MTFEQRCRAEALRRGARRVGLGERLRRWSSPGGSFLVLWLATMLLLSWIQAQDRWPETALAGAALLLYGLALVCGAGFKPGWGEPSVEVLAPLPASDREILAEAWRERLRSSAWVPAVLFVWHVMGGWVEALLAALLAWAVWIACVALASRLGGFGCLAALFVVPIGLWTMAAPSSVPDGMVDFVLLLTPLGWVEMAWLGHGLGWLVPAGLLGGLALQAARRVAGEFQLEVPSGPVEVEPVEPGAEVELPDPRVKARMAGWAGSYLDGWSWGEMGPLERWFARGLDERHRLLVEVLLGSPPAWSAAWKTCLVLTAMVVGLELSWPQRPTWLVVGLAGLALLLGLPLGISRATVRCGTGAWPLDAVLPVGFREMARVVGRAYTVRWAALAPLLVVGVTAHCHADPLRGLEVGLAAALALWALVPLAAVAELSQMSSDLGPNLAWRMAALLIGAAAGIALVVWMVAFAELRLPDSLLAVAGLRTVAAGVLRLHGGAYEAGCYDLVQSDPADARGL